MTRLTFLLALLLPASALAGEAYNLKLGGKMAELRLVEKPKSDVQLDLYTDEKLRQSFPDLGTEFGKLGFKGAWHSVLVSDLDHNGFDVFLVRTRIQPLTGAVWVFRFNHEKKVYQIVPNENGDRYISVPLEGVVELFSNGELAFPGKGGGAAVRYRWTGAGFRPK